MRDHHPASLKIPNLSTQTQESEEKYNNYTLTHITLAQIIIVLASIILCSLQLKLEAVERFNALNS